MNFTFYVNRLTEPSTWAAIAALAWGIAGTTTGSVSTLAGAIGAACAALAAFLKDPGAPDKKA